MKAPDKIYISKFDIANSWDSVAGIALTTPHPQSKEDEYVPYIRKEAILEWAKEVTNNTNHSLVYRGAFRDLIDKLNSL